QERRLHIDTENDAEPDQVDAEMFRRRTKERDHDEGELEIIEEEGEHEDEGIDEQQEANLPAGQRGEQAFHPDVAADAVEGQRKHPRADQDEDDEGGQFRCGFRGLAHQIPVKRRLSAPRMSAPLAPMAPPSVGVATPMKMVPSTRKIRNSGGTMTNAVCCAIRERKRKPVRRSITQFTIATANANRMPKNMDSTT